MNSRAAKEKLQIDLLSVHKKKNPWFNKILRLLCSVALIVVFVSNYNSTQLKRDATDTKKQEAKGSELPMQLSYPYPALSHSLSLVIGGCSSSTAAMEFMRDVMQAHGINLYKISNVELLREDTNEMYETAKHQLEKKSLPTPSYEKIVVEAMDMFKNEVVRGDKVLFYKSSNYLFNRSGVKEGLKLINTMFTHAYRQNNLDLMICMARDCFYRNFGYTVFAENGTRADLCFKRRTSDVKTKVYIENPSRLIANIRRSERTKATEVKELKQLIYPASSQITEALFEYQYSMNEEVFKKSQDAWVSLMASLIVVDPAILIQVMRKHQGQRPPPLPTAEAIYNYDEVVTALRNTQPPLDHYVRL